MLFYLIIGSSIILTIIIIFAFHIKQENKSLAASREKLNKAQKAQKIPFVPKACSYPI